MKNLEPKSISRVENAVGRINPDEAFAEVYSEYQSDMERVSNLRELYDRDSQELGKLAETVVFKGMVNHPINEYFNLRQTSLYDDYLHGADLVVEPRGSLIQAVAAIDLPLTKKI
jgi:hypothetical protein